MTPSVAAEVLRLASMYDNRTITEEVAIAWSAVLDGLPLVDCQNAVVEHYKRNTDWLMPAMIRAAVKRVRRDRLAAAGDLTPPSGLGELEQRAWLRTTRRRIGDGETYIAPELPAVAPERIKELIAHVGEMP